HLRDGAMLTAVARFTAERFGRAIVMPNLAPEPVTTTEKAQAYRTRILEVTKEYKKFTPLMTIYLTEHTDPEDVEKGFRSGVVKAAKLYPAHSTTNSAQGVTDMKTILPVLKKMEEIGMPLLVHGETVRDFDDAVISPEKREEAFLATTLPKLLKHFPNLKIVLEHVTTAQGVEFVKRAAMRRLAATVTAHHLMMTMEDVLGSDTPAHFSCTPVPKTEEDFAALREAATSGDPHFFLGTDSAPHPVSAKEGQNPPPGIFTALAGLELYAQVFDDEGRLDKLEAFASVNGANFYGMPVNEETVTLVREPWTIDAVVSMRGGESIRPFGYHEKSDVRLPINWRIR
ncbi:MAG: dihydroorotase, partial [Patescibacteria group bacterium]